MKPGAELLKDEFDRPLFSSQAKLVERVAPLPWEVKDKDSRPVSRAGPAEVSKPKPDYTAGVNKLDGGVNDDANGCDDDGDSSTVVGTGTGAGTDSTG